MIGESAISKGQVAKLIREVAATKHPRLLVVQDKKVHSIKISFHEEGFLLAVYKNPDQEFKETKKHWGRTQQEALAWVGLVVPESKKYNDNF